jgi:hypothetical protein
MAGKRLKTASGVESDHRVDRIKPDACTRVKSSKQSIASSEPQLPTNSLSSIFRFDDKESHESEHWIVSNDGSTGNALLVNAHAEKPLGVRLPNEFGIAEARVPAFATSPTYQRCNLLLIQRLYFVNDAIPYNCTQSTRNR